MLYICIWNIILIKIKLIDCEYWDRDVKRYMIKVCWEIFYIINIIFCMNMFMM